MGLGLAVDCAESTPGESRSSEELKARGGKGLEFQVYSRSWISVSFPKLSFEIQVESIMLVNDPQFKKKLLSHRFIKFNGKWT